MKQVMHKLIGMVGVALILIFIQPIPALAGFANAPDVSAESAVLIDAESGQVLVDQQGHEVREIASTTKMIVQYITLSKIHAGELDWEEPVNISDYVMDLTEDPKLANLPLNQEDTFTVRELFMGMSIASANAMTVALAGHIAGSEEAFVTQMRELMTDWGLEDAHLVNATGLNNEDLQGGPLLNTATDDENRMSARSLAAIAQRLVTDFPEILEITALTSYTYRPDSPAEQDVSSYNFMLPGFPYAYPGVKGLKTGTTINAGGSFVGYLDQEPTPLISVVLHAGDGFMDKFSRFDATAKLFDYAMADLEYINVPQVNLHHEELTDYPVADGTIETVDLEIEGNLPVYLPEEVADLYEVTYEMDQSAVDKNEQLQPPFVAGETVGTATVHPTEAGLDYLGDLPEDYFTFPIVTTKASEQLNIFQRLQRNISQWWKNLR